MAKIKIILQDVSDDMVKVTSEPPVQKIINRRKLGGDVSPAEHYLVIAYLAWMARSKENKEKKLEDLKRNAIIMPGKN